MRYKLNDVRYLRPWSKLFHKYNPLHDIKYKLQFYSQGTRMQRYPCFLLIWFFWNIPFKTVIRIFSNFIWTRCVRKENFRTLNEIKQSHHVEQEILQIPTMSKIFFKVLKVLSNPFLDFPINIPIAAKNEVRRWHF